MTAVQSPWLYLELFNVVGGDIQADTDGDEDQSDNEESGQDGASR